MEAFTLAKNVGESVPFLFHQFDPTWHHEAISYISRVYYKSTTVMRSDLRELCQDSRDLARK
jgi:hypothetical protein